MPNYSLFPTAATEFGSRPNSIRCSTISYARPTTPSGLASISENISENISECNSIPPTPRSAYEFLPPIRCTTPLSVDATLPAARITEHHKEEPHLQRRMTQRREEPQPEIIEPESDEEEPPHQEEDNGEENVDQKRYYTRQSLQKELPTVPMTVFDRLQQPESFVPTRRAPLPPPMQSWIDMTDDETDATTESDSVMSRGLSRSTTSSPTSLASYRLEKEIMRMLAFNEEKELQRRLEEKKAKDRKGKSTLMQFVGRIRRSFSLKVGSGSPVWNGERKPAHYFEYFV